jgi:hypothetical protein
MIISLVKFYTNIGFINESVFSVINSIIIDIAKQEKNFLGRTYNYLGFLYNVYSRETVPPAQLNKEFHSVKCHVSFELFFLVYSATKPRKNLENTNSNRVSYLSTVENMLLC